MDGPLKGVRVLDLSRVLAGPYASMLLADMGADVIKVERPLEGDDSRGFGPFHEGQSAYFMSINRGKRSIVLDLKNEVARTLVRRLADRSDVLLENFRPGVMERLGLGYEVLSASNPRLIYCACSGFGASGRYAHRPAYDAIVQGMGGIMSVTGPEGGPPVRVGASIGDIGAALFAAVGVGAALYERERSGRGQFLDVAMLDCQVAMLVYTLASYLLRGEVPGPLGTRHPQIAPFQGFVTADGHVIVGVANNSLWDRFCRVVAPHLLDDQRFRDNPSRVANHRALEAELAPIFRTRTTTEWLALLEEAGVPCGPINTVDKVAADPYLKERGMLVPIPMPSGEGTLVVAGCPLRFSRTPAGPKGPPPFLGAHTEEVLRKVLGMSDEEIRHARESGAFGPVAAGNAASEEE